MIITVDDVEIVLSQSSDKAVTIFVEMRDFLSCLSGSELFLKCA